LDAINRDQSFDSPSLDSIQTKKEKREKKKHMLSIENIFFPHGEFS